MNYFELFKIFIITHQVKSAIQIPPIFQFDDYDSCRINHPQISDFFYCTITLQILPKNVQNSSTIWRSIEEISANSKNYRHDLLIYGVCLESSCPDDFPLNSSMKNALKKCYDKKFNHLELVVNVNRRNCQKNSEDLYTIDNYDLIVGSCLVIYLIFIMFASLFEGILRYQPLEEYRRKTETTHGRFLAAFSIPKNWFRLTTIKNDDPDLRLLRAIQGVRFYNMILVILSHTVMSMAAGPVSNTQFFENMTDNTSKMLLANGGYAVQTYFIISGWLLTYHLLIYSESKNEIGVGLIVMVFLRRLIRLTPALVVMVAIHSTWLVHLGSGPFWDEIVGREYRNCRKNWWTNLLYINNYYDKENMCMQQTWYAATDTQLFLMALFIIMLAVKFPNYTKTVLVIAPTILGVFIKFAIAYINDYDILVRMTPTNLYDYLLGVPFWHIMYASAYSNITGYTVGMAFGYFFYKTRKNHQRVTKFYIVLWWILTFVPALFVILIAAVFYAQDYQHNRLLAALYWGCASTIYSISIAIGIFGLTQKIGWVVRWCCEWRPVQILGRLTFTAYLVHVAIIKIRVGLIRHPLYISEFTIMHFAFGDIVSSYLAATILCLIVEMPISALDKMLFSSKNNNKKIDV